jgi:hypothetical protein
MRSSTIGVLVLALGIIGLLLVLGVSIWWLLIVGAVLWFSLRMVILNDGSIASGRVRAFLIPAEAATSATINVDHSTGRLMLGHGNTANALAEGRCSVEVEPTATRRGDDVTVNVKAAENALLAFLIPWQWHPHNWNVGLQRGQDLTVKVEGAMSRIHLNFTELTLHKLHLQLGLSRAQVMLPRAAGVTAVHVQMGLSNVELHVPEGVAARISLDGAVGTADIDTERFPRQGAYYQSLDYASATNRVDMRINYGFASVTVT